ncbi:MAG: hypothetical protein AB3N24_22925 [Leisingera sp.]
MRFLPARPVLRDDLPVIAGLPDSPGANAAWPRSAPYVYPNHSLEVISSCYNSFPEGAFASGPKGATIGFVNAIRLPGCKILAPHEWWNAIGQGTGSTHEPDGDWLYVCRLLLTAGPGHASLLHELVPLLDALNGLAVQAGLTGVAFAAPFPGKRNRSGTTDFQRSCFEDPRNMIHLAGSVIGCAEIAGFRHELALPNYLGHCRHFALLTWRP